MNAVRWSHRHTLIFAALVLLLAGIVLPFAAVPATAQDQTEIRFAFWGDPAEEAAYQAVVDSFESAHPEIDVIVDYTPGQSDYYRKIASDFAAGDAPDVYLTNYRQFGQYASAGGLAPIQSYLDNSATIAESDYYELSLDAFRFGAAGELYCLPQNISSLVVYYNDDLFEAAGVPVPEDGWSWDTFVSAAQALTQDTDGDGTIDQYGVVVTPSMYRMVSWIWGSGGEVVDDIANPTTLTIDTPEALAGLEKFVSLGVSGYNVVPPEEEVAAEADQDRFMRGGAAMFIQSRRPVPTLREITDFSWNVTSLPVLDQAATVLHSDAFCMAANADNQDAVWTFIEYAGSAEGQLLLAETGRTVPSMISVSESDVFLKGVPRTSSDASPVSSPEAVAPLPPSNAQVYLDNVTVMHRLPSISTWVEVEDAFDAEFDRSFYIEGFDVAAAAQAAIASSKDAFDRAST
ncbi:MAG: sugar ABC transporter substrate-binding protein [Thermomicrobiales bacterium]|nr:sugar ABC transporter substrate-binding protein [Thermomicrobiales bacterium]